MNTSDYAVPVTARYQSLASEGAESEDISMGTSLPCSPSGSAEPNDSQESHQCPVLEGNKLPGEMPEDTPVALQRSKRQHQDVQTLDHE